MLAIDHVGIAVPDLEAAITFHTTVLGGVLDHRETNEEQGVEEAMISLRQTAPSCSCWRRSPRSRPSRGSWIAAAPVCSSWPIGWPMSGRPLPRPDAAGIRTLFDEPRRGTHGSAINFLHPKDAGGVLIELVQPAR